VHPGIDPETVAAATGWDLAVAPAVGVTPQPTAQELDILRDLVERSKV
jgi:glutaconate CoA-transferase subunit B